MDSTVVNVHQHVVVASGQLPAATASDSGEQIANSADGRQRRYLWHSL